MEERASCLFVRRIAEERRRASSCFSRVAAPFPCALRHSNPHCVHFFAHYKFFGSRPPPPPQVVADASGAASQRAQRERLGDLEKYEVPRKTDSAEWSFDKSGAIDGTKALIASLGETNPVLKGLLATAMDEIEVASGRRLMQRIEYQTYMTDVLVTHELMEFYGKGGIPGLSIGSCQALCEATKQDERAKHTEHCNAYAFKRAAPFSYTDQTGWCYLLQNAGGCKLEDFSSELLTRSQFSLEHRHPTIRVRTQTPFTAGKSSRSDSAARARPGWTTRSASASQARGTILASSPTPTRPPLPTRCRTTGTPRRAVVGCPFRAPPSLNTKLHTHQLRTRANMPHPGARKSRPCP